MINLVIVTDMTLTSRVTRTKRQRKKSLPALPVDLNSECQKRLYKPAALNYTKTENI